METLLPTVAEALKEVAVTKAPLMRLHHMRTQLENEIKLWSKKDVTKDLAILSQPTYEALKLHDNWSRNGRYGVKQRARKLYKVHARIRFLEARAAERRPVQLPLPIS